METSILSVVPKVLAREGYIRTTHPFNLFVDNRYLTEIGKVDVYWTGSRLSQLPEQLPPVGKNISRQAIVPWRYHFNTGSPLLGRQINKSNILIHNGMVGMG